MGKNVFVSNARMNIIVRLKSPDENVQLEQPFCHLIQSFTVVVVQFLSIFDRPTTNVHVI